MLNAIVDMSHWNTVTSFAEVKEAGIVGVIHKATGGTNFQDPMYWTRRPQALDAGLLWGAYHFGEAGDGVAQAEYFLSFVKPTPTDLLVLDFEPNPSGGTMTLQEAEQFVTQVQAATGRWPGLYGSPTFLNQALGGQPSPTLSSCWLWLADYAATPVLPTGWPLWTLWQYTDGQHGPEPYSVSGIGNCDRDQFNGSLEGLQRLWGVLA